MMRLSEAVGMLAQAHGDRQKWASIGGRSWEGRDERGIGLWWMMVATIC